MIVFENVRQVIKKLIPSSLLSDIACYVFYDNHPKDEKNIDITICTKDGELREYFQRDLKSSLNLHSIIKKPSDLRILRNNNSELFYLLSTEDELFIISSKEKLQVHRKLTNIDRYDVDDIACSGETCLKIIRKDDAVPLLFDGNLECLDCGVMLDKPNNEDTFPVLTELKRKLVEARYTAKCNEKIYAQYLNLHQKVSLLSYQSQQPTDSSIFQDNIKSTTGALKLKTNKPWVKVCNKKIVIMFNVLIQCQESLQNIHILLHNAAPSLVYSTKIFTKVPTSPYWQEASTTTLKLEQEYVIAAVIDMDEFKQNVSSRIDLSGSIVYMLSKEVLIPFEDVVVSSSEVMGDEFDVLSTNKNDQNSIIAILAATEKTELCLRLIKEDNEPDISMLELFCTHLQMERVENASNVIVYRKSPYHALNGILLVFHERNSDNATPVSVYTRSSTQVATLLHCIYDAVPARVIATTPTYKITSKTDNQSHNEHITHTNKRLNFMNYATSMLNRSRKILDHLDMSMMKMNESNNPLVQSRVGTHIDLFAGGVEKFKEFREGLIKEAEKAVDLMKSEGVAENNVTLEEEGVDSKSDSMEHTGSDVMYID